MLEDLLQRNFMNTNGPTPGPIIHLTPTHAWFCRPLVQEVLLPWSHRSSTHSIRHTNTGPYQRNISTVATSWWLPINTNNSTNVFNISTVNEQYLKVHTVKWHALILKAHLTASTGKRGGVKRCPKLHPINFPDFIEKKRAATQSPLLFTLYFEEHPELPQTQSYSPAPMAVGNWTLNGTSCTVRLIL